MTTSLQKAFGRVEKKRSHKLRNTLTVLGVGGIAVAAALPGSRRRLTGLVSKGGNRPAHDRRGH